MCLDTEIQIFLCVFVYSKSAEAEKVLDKVKEFITSLSSFTDGENQRLSDEVSTDMVQSKMFNQVLWNKQISSMNVMLGYYTDNSSE